MSERKVAIELEPIPGIRFKAELTIPAGIDLTAEQLQLWFDRNRDNGELFGEILKQKMAAADPTK